MTLNRQPYRSLLLFILVLALTAATGSAHAESRAYQLNNRPGADVAVQVRELYQGEPVSVTARGQQLVVRGNQQLLDEIGTLIETLDVAPAQLRITVRSQKDIGGKRSGGGVTTTRNELGVTEHRWLTGAKSDGYGWSVRSYYIRPGADIAFRGARRQKPCSYL